jgi:Flp pilus assembly pilin Flp
VVVLVVVAVEVAVVAGAVVVLVAGGDIVVGGALSPLWQAANASKTARKPPRARRLMRTQ